MDGVKWVKSAEKGKRRGGRKNEKGGSLGRTRVKRGKMKGRGIDYIPLGKKE